MKKQWENHKRCIRTEKGTWWLFPGTKRDREITNKEKTSWKKYLISMILNWRVQKKN